MRFFCIILYSLLFLLYSFIWEISIMKTSNVLLDKSLLFSARIVRLYQYLLKNKHETVISKQEWSPY